jgi:hypothetical protein
MKKTILTIMLLCSSAWAAYAPVANTKVSGSATTSSAINTTGANLLVAYAVAFAAVPTVPNDSKGNVYVACGSDATIGNSHGRIFYVANPVVGSGHTVTTMTGSFPTLFISAWSGADTSSPCDQSNTGTFSGSNVTLPSTTPSVAGELVITGLSDNSSDNPTISDVNFTIQDTQLSTSNEGVA